MDHVRIQMNRQNLRNMDLFRHVTEILFTSKIAWSSRHTHTLSSLHHSVTGVFMKREFRNGHVTEIAVPVCVFKAGTDTYVH